MGLIDSLKRSRVRFAEDSDEESKTAFLDGKTSVTPAKRGAVIALNRSLYWTMYTFMITTILLLSITVLQCRSHGITEPTEYWSQDILGKGIASTSQHVLAVELTDCREPLSTHVRKCIQSQLQGHPRD